MSWQFTDATNRAASRILPDGAVESCLASALEPGTEVSPAPAGSANDAIMAEIATIEATTMVPRVTREFMLRVAEKDAAANGIDLTKDVAYQRVKAVDDQVAALRARLA